MTPLLINQTKNHISYGGSYFGEAEKEFQDFIEKTGIPAASTILGLSALDTDHPNYVGMVGMHGSMIKLLTNECDVLLQ